MKKLQVLTVAVVLAGVFASQVQAQKRTYVVDRDSFGAIAYSPSTGYYGYSYDYGSRYTAERAALKHCEEKDARVVCWVRAGFCALAVGDDKTCWGVGYSYGNGASLSEAMNNALEECRKRTTGARVVLYLLSDGQLVRDLKPHKGK